MMDRYDGISSNPKPSARPPPHGTERKVPKVSSGSRLSESFRPPSPKAKPDPDSSSSSSLSSDNAPPLSRSYAFTRRPNFSNLKAKSQSKQPLGLLSSADEDDDDDETPAFLPFSTARSPNIDPPPTLPSPSATLRKFPLQPRPPPPRLPSAPLPTPHRVHASKTDTQKSQHSSSSSTSQIPSPPIRSSHGALSALSPRQRRVTRDESEGTLSMGSSFSDLDDASVTQSALEEALAREIQQGRGSLGVVGRMGGLWRGSVGGRGLG